ncbi:MAG: thioredoxin domain-containing protein [Myxococcota bacterium]
MHRIARSILTTTVPFMLLSCAAQRASAPPCAAAPVVPSDLDSPDRILGSVDGVSVRVRDLGTEARARIADQENEAAQRRLHLLWLAIDEAIGQRVLAREAHSRQLSVDELLVAELGKRMQPVTDDELSQVYDANREVIDMPFEQAQELLRKQLTRQRHEEAERSYLDELREGADVRYAIDVPVLQRVAVDIGSAPAQGPTTAKVTLVVFADFQCPYCARARQLTTALRSRYPETLRVVYRYFPLPQHTDAGRAAEAAHCAAEQDKFWPYHELLYDHMQALGEDDLKTYATEVGLDANDFASCRASERPRKAVRSSIDAGERAGVRGTPALFLNGIKLVGLLPMPLMQTLIDRELAN